MDLLTYINYHYIDETPDWVKNAMGLGPKPLFEIIVDLLLKVIILMITFMLLVWGSRLLLLIWRIHNEKVRELEELNRRMAQEELEDLLRPPSGIGEGDSANNPEDDDDDDERREE